MTKEELYELFASRFEREVNFYCAEVILRENLVPAALDIALLPDSPQAFRAAYALETAFFRHPETFAPFYGRFVSDFSKAVHPSVHRHYGKIVAWLLKRKKVRLSVPETERLAETACLRLVDETSKVAVRVWALEILDLLAPQVEWVADELPAIAERLSLDPSPALLCRLKKRRKSQ